MSLPMTKYINWCVTKVNKWVFDKHKLLMIAKQNINVEHILFRGKLWYEIFMDCEQG